MRSCGGVRSKSAPTVENDRLELLGSSAMLTVHTLPSATDIYLPLTPIYTDIYLYRARCET
jgi:hypothetical protein